MKPWKQTSSRFLGDYRVFKLRADRVMSPRTGGEHEFFVLDCPNWVNVVALTPDDQVVLVQQYRHGSGTVELEVPGGVMDSQDASPVEAAVRELREETGYEGERARVIGHVYANPAILSNTCFTVFVENCQLRHPVCWDQSEDLVTRVVPADRLPELVAGGTIRHSLVIVALYHFDLLRRGQLGQHDSGAQAENEAGRD